MKRLTLFFAYACSQSAAPAPESPPVEPPPPDVDTVAEPAPAPPTEPDQPVGCANGAPCPPGQVCCTGVPYPQEGSCHDECLMKSDRDTKEGFASIDRQALLEAVASLPITTWSYRDDGTRHLGPMAQDFQASFGLGGDARTIASVDAHGVALAAIQALYERVVRLEEENARLRAAAHRPE